MEKGSGVFSHIPFGHPRRRNVDFSPRRFAVRNTHTSSPNGRPRFTLVRSASSSAAPCARFTLANQSPGEAMSNEGSAMRGQC